MIKTFTYDLAGGATTVNLNRDGFKAFSSAVSMQVQGNGAVDGTATIKLQESNDFGVGLTDIAGATITANVSSDEFVADKVISGAYLAYDIAIGTATAGIVTITLEFKQ